MTVTAVTFVLEQHLGHRTYADNLRAAFEHSDDLDAFWVPVDYAPASSVLSRMPLPHQLRSAIAGRAEVRRGLRSRNADVVVFNTQVPAALGGRQARSRPYVAITDVTPIQYDAMAGGYGHRADTSGFVSNWKHRVNRSVFRHARQCVAWSSWAASSIINDYDVPSHRVSVVPPGVDTTMWSPSTSQHDERFRILFVGGDFTRKGGEVLLRAFALLPPHAELYVVTRSRVTPSDRVHVIDDLGPNDPRLIQLFRSCDVFALPSCAETFGIAAVEACAAGLPVVASNVGGLVDIVLDGETGALVSTHDVQELAAVLSRLESDRQLCRRLGEGARAHALANFDANANAARLLQIIASAQQ